MTTSLGNCSYRRHRRTKRVAKADQVLGDQMQFKQRNHPFGVANLELVQPSPLFDPAKHLLDASAGFDQSGVALMPVSAAIDG